MWESTLYSSPRKWLNVLCCANYVLTPFDPNPLGSVSRQLSAAIFSSLPQLRPYAQMVKVGESDGLSLILTVPSPIEDSSGKEDSGREFVIWVDETGTPSIGFGAEHTHANLQEDGIAEIIDRAKAILEDKLLIIIDIGGEYPGHSAWIDLRDPQALAEELTSPYSPGRALLNPGQAMLTVKSAWTICRAKVPRTDALQRAGYISKAFVESAVNGTDSIGVDHVTALNSNKWPTKR